jgi:TRAP-type transport system periplasmic protein
MHKARNFAMGRAALVVAMAAAWQAPAPARAAEASAPYVMKLSLATINDSQHQWCTLFAAAVEKDSAGRIKAEIYPASQLGSIPRQIEGVQFGAIQAYIGPPEFLVGIDPRYELMSAPGLVNGNEHAERLSADPEVQKLILGLGANKGLHGIGLMIAQPTSVISKAPLRHLADFKGKKLRVLAAQMQEDMLSRFGATPVAMTLGDVLPAIQQGAIDGAVAAITVYTTMQYYDAAKYVTELGGGPYIFSVAVMSKKWFDALPKDLQQIVDADGAKAAAATNPWAASFFDGQRKVWTEKNGELISLPSDEQAKFRSTIDSIGADVTKSKPELRAAYDTLLAAAKRTD